jgi:hypothetical protein
VQESFYRPVDEKNEYAFNFKMMIRN